MLQNPLLRCVCFWILPLLFITMPEIARSADPLDDLDISTILPVSASTQIIKVFGIMNNHRPYHGAVPMGNSLDMGAEVSLVHLPADFGQSLSDAGLLDDPDSIGIGALPTLKAHIHKGMGKNAEIGASGLYFRGNKIWGLDFKYAFLIPEEGMTWAFRLSYAATDLDLSRFGMKSIPVSINGIEVGEGNLILNTSTITPQIVGSLRLDYMEPYIGAGVEYAKGLVKVAVTIPALDRTEEISTPEYTSTQITAFTGVSLRVPEVGLYLTLEGGYGSLGMSYLGLMTGFVF